jgi:uncharacterized membrane protein
MTHDRFIEIDVAKGFAVVLMMCFHYFYLGKHMGVFDANTSSGWLFMFAKVAHTIFILTSGANLAISTSGKTPTEYIPKKIKRGLYLVVIGLFISYFTKIEFGDNYVRFGILHFLGVATILSSFVMKSPTLTYLFAGIILLFHGLLTYTNLKDQFVDICDKNPLTCFISGIMNTKYNSLDHFSLVPYLGVFLLGSGIAFTCYKINTVQEDMANLEDVGIVSLTGDWKNKNSDNHNIDSAGDMRNVKFLGLLDNHKDSVIVKIVSWVGQRSMMFYITHFVVLYCLFKLILMTRANNILDVNILDVDIV